MNILSSLPAVHICPLVLAMTFCPSQRLAVRAAPESVTASKEVLPAGRPRADSRQPAQGWFRSADYWYDQMATSKEDVLPVTPLRLRFPTVEASSRDR